MTNAQGEPSLQLDPPASKAARPIRDAAVIGGVGLLLMSVLAGLGNLVVLEGLVTEGDAARTAADITASAGMFRLGVACMLLVVVLDVVVAWALLQVFSPVDRSLSQLAAWFRLAYAAVFLAAIGQLAVVPGLLQPDGHPSALGDDQLEAQALLKIETFDSIWSAGLLLFGVHLLLIGYLAYRSVQVPTLVGVLVAVAGAGYVFDSLVAVLHQGSAISISSATFIGELLLALWLVARGRRLSTWEDRHAI